MNTDNINKLSTVESEHFMKNHFQNGIMKRDMIRACGSSQFMNSKKGNLEEVNFVGVFSDLLTYTDGFASLNPETIEKYPHGFVSENKFLITDYLSKIHFNNGNERKNPKEYSTHNLSLIAFVYNMTAIIEHKYNINFNEDEINKIFSLTFYKTYELEKDLALYKDHSPIKPIFVSNNELQEIYGTSNPVFALYCKNSTTSNSYIDQFLFNSAEVNNPDHPFSKLKSLIIEPIHNTTTVNSLEDFTRLATQCENPESLQTIFRSLKSINEDNLKKSIDLDDFLNNMKQLYTPCLLLLQDKYFSVAFNNFKLDLEKSNLPYLVSSNQDLRSDVRELIALQINDYNEHKICINLNQRDILIKTITDFSLIDNQLNFPFNSTYFCDSIPQDLLEKSITEQISKKPKMK